MLEDTIAAIATAPGIGGIGIIRVSGKEAFSVVSHVFKPKDAFFNILNPTPNTIKYGTIIENDKVIDEVLVSFFKAPNSYTTENTVEINCHGGIVVVRKILDLLFKTIYKNDIEKDVFLPYEKSLYLLKKEAYITKIIETDEGYKLHGYFKKETLDKWGLS